MGLSPLIYLDYNRTTPVASGVIDAMKPYWNTHFMLPGQDHPAAMAVGEALELAREQVASLVGCEAFELVFTSGGTEANNLAILGGVDIEVGGHALISRTESDAVVAAGEFLRRHGWQIETIPCDDAGMVDPDDVRERFQDQTRLVCLQLANPFLGTIQPVRQIGQLCRQRGVSLHCDATDALGKTPVDVAHLCVDTMSLSGHKFFGPKGTGAVFVRRGLTLQPIHHGEPREMGLRPGSENVPGYIGMGAAATMAARCAIEADGGLKDLRNELVVGLLAAIDDDLIELAIDTPRLPNTVALEMPGDVRRIQHMARQLVVATPQSDVPPDEMTRTLRAIGRTPKQIGRTLHMSVGWTTTRDEILRATEILAEACDAVRP